jgi:predicted nucleotidyltransferase|tara:strand:+ start:939 stop:1484 length:546 start_codon:yes stop_codon:yes gene_type:complete
MDMYKLKFTTLQNEIFRLFCIKAGIFLNQRGIARILKVSPTAIANALPLLNKEKLIKIDKSKEMNLTLVQFNRDNARAINLKRIENLKLIYESGLVNFLFESFPGATIILFGSYSRGEDTLESDIDIAIIGVKEKNLDLIKFDKLLERNIIINFYNSFKEIHKHLRDSILNGILLSGSIDI